MELFVVWLLSCVQLFWDPMDCTPPGFSVHGISEAKILECVAISFSREASRSGIEPTSPALQADSFLAELPGDVVQTLKIVTHYIVPL